MAFQERAFATGFSAASGYPVGNVYLTTTWSTGGRGSHPATFSAWVSAIWDFTGTMTSYAKLATAPTVNPTFSATDALGVTVDNASNRAYLTVPAPATPSGVKAIQVGDQFQVSWTQSTNPALISASTVTATPVGSTAPVLTVTVSGSGTSGLVGPLPALTTYQITVLSTDAGGSSPASSPISATSAAGSVPPSAPTAVFVHLTNPGNPGDMLAAGWAVAGGGNSPVDQYQVTATVYGDTGPTPITQTVSGSMLSAYLAADDGDDWSVQVRAHDAAGWGPWSTPTILGGA